METAGFRGLQPRRRFAKNGAAVQMDIYELDTGINVASRGAAFGPIGHASLRFGIVHHGAPSRRRPPTSADIREDPTAISSR